MQGTEKLSLLSEGKTCAKTPLVPRKTKTVTCWALFYKTLKALDFFLESYKIWSVSKDIDKSLISIICEGLLLLPCVKKAPDTEMSMRIWEKMVGFMDYDDDDYDGIESKRE